MTFWSHSFCGQRISKGQDCANGDRRVTKGTGEAALSSSNVHQSSFKVVVKLFWLC